MIKLNNKQKTDIKKFNEEIYKNLNGILKIINKKLYLKIYSNVFNIEDEYYTSFRIKNTVSNDTKEKLGIDQEEVFDKENVFNELNVNNKFNDKEFIDKISDHLNENRYDEKAESELQDSIDDKVPDESISSGKNRINLDNTRMLYANKFEVKIDSGQYKIIYIIEVKNLDTETLDIFYGQPYCSFLRLVLDYYFLDFYNLDDKNVLVYDENIINKYNEGYINYVRRISRVFFGKIQSALKNNTPNKEYFKNIGNELDSKYYINNLIEQINDISDRTYENLNPFGSILFSNKTVLDGNDKIEYTIKFEDDNKIKLDNFKMIRKLLEMTNKEQNLYLISDCENVIGLGKVKWDLIEDNVLFRVDFNGLSKYNLIYVCVEERENDRGTIDISSNKKIYKYNKNIEIVEKKLINILFKNPKIEEEYNCEKFKSILKQELFNDKNRDLIDINIKKIEEVVSKAREQKHGTMVVISDVETVEKELKLLKKQAILINKTEIDSKYIKHLTSIDGAIYFDIDGKCHAIGVILDGRANENIGDSSRGARYNSAYKYFNKLQEDSNKKCVIVVISEDGMVDIIPEVDNEEKIVLAYEIIDLIRRGKESLEEFIKKEKTFAEDNCSILDYQLYFKIADAFFEKEKYERSYDYYSKGLNIAKNENIFIASIHWSRIAYIYSHLADFELKKKEHDVADLKNKYLESIRYYEKVINISDKNGIDVDATIFNNLGYDYVQVYGIEKNKEYYEKAIENYSKAITAKGKPVYYSNRGLAYKVFKMYKEALSDYIEFVILSDEEKKITNKIEKIKEILDENNNLVENAIKLYKKRLDETKKEENNQLKELLEQYLPSLDEVSNEVAVDGKID